jgi:DNA helicase II / ATP-dependent DNA helicase PcrA
MRFIADFHIHSHYSIATSRDLTPEKLDFWARRKGIQVIGTGDMVHPGWFEELREKLIPDREGLFALKDEFRIKGRGAAFSEDQPARFILSGEISNIYKDKGKVRKVHNLILASSFETVTNIQKKLDHIGNIRSDGRPILGISSHDLLEIALEGGEDAVFIPAHIWTPWFSALGAKSGYESIEECFDDLTGHIFAVETGLSSDPPMNWLCSFLDRYTLVSNSDAHSPEKLGREANLFDTELSYPKIISAMKGQDPQGFKGTIEFFPQEGKYHLDGHRKCGIRWTPQETEKKHGICPVCGKPVTVGVLNRVIQLSDREDGQVRPVRKPYYPLTPLKNILAEIKGVGPNSKSVQGQYEFLLDKGGPEFKFLLDLSREEISRVGGELMGEAVRRLRNSEVYIEEGYDGAYGRITVFRPGEVNSLLSQMSLFEQPHKGGGKKGRAVKTFPRNDNKAEGQSREGLEGKEAGDTLMNDLQKKAVEHYKGACLVLSGPGTGKTFVLATRVVRLIQERGVSPENILAITFTNKAAEEMQKRIARDLGDEKTAGEITVTTFHSFGMSILRRYASFFGRSPEFLIFGEEEKVDLLQSSVGLKEKGLKRIADAISLAKNRMQGPEGVENEYAEPYRMYEEMLRKANAFDIDDLVFCAARLLEEYSDAAKEIRETFTWLCIDEYQDINSSQYRLIRLLCPDDTSHIFAIGDPNQAIYGFRGADAHFIQRFKDDYPSAAVFRLSKSYRCPDRILRASSQVVSPDGKGEFLKGMAGDVSVHIEPCSTEKSEAEFVARTIENMIGGVRFFSMDSNISDGSERDQPLSFSDFAVLFRVSNMAPDIIKALDDHGMPFQRIGEEPFYRKEPVSTIIDALKLIENPHHELILRRLKNKNIGEKFLESIMKIRIDKDLYPLGDCITNIGTKYLPEITKSHGDELEKITSMADTCDNNLSLFLSRLSLGSPVDTYNKAAEQVTLMSIHASKGLEFPCVFIIGCEDGILPFTLLGQDGCNREEERKLLYVGMTRAKAALFLSYAGKRRLYNRYFELPQSPFLHSIKEELIERGEKKIRKRGLRDRQLSLFS